MGKSVEFYLSKGYDQKMAEYFAAGRKRITKVVPEENFTLLLTFDNGETRLYDVRPLLETGTVFAPFREWKHFRRVYLDENDCVSIEQETGMTFTVTPVQNTGSPLLRYQGDCLSGIIV